MGRRGGGGVEGRKEGWVGKGKLVQATQNVRGGKENKKKEEQYRRSRREREGEMNASPSAVG